MQPTVRAASAARSISCKSPLKAPAIHGHDGVSRKAACRSCASHYYSYTRLRTSGTLTYGGEKLAVDGLSWMDHEFGSDELQPDQTGWDWFSIQLDDGRELMLYRLRRKDGSVTPESSGSLIERDGRVRYVPLAAFAIEATGTWTSPHTDARYPSGWRVRLPARTDRSRARRRSSPTKSWRGRTPAASRIGKARSTFETLPIRAELSARGTSNSPDTRARFRSNSA